MNNPARMKTFNNIDLIKIYDGRYAVRKNYTSFFGRKKQTYFCLPYNGTHFTDKKLTEGITIGGLERCEFIFNANAVLNGGL